MKQNILFTCAGRRNYLINYFKDALKGNGNVIAVDQDLLAPALVDADIAIRVPDIYDENYISELLKIASAYSVTAIISLNDLELPILSKNKKKFEDKGTKVIISNQKVIDIGFDKLKTFEFFKSIGVNTPNTYTSLDVAIKAIHNGELNLPVVLKPRWGSASIGIDFPETIEELELYYKIQRIKIEKTILGIASKSDIEHSILIQEKLDGIEYGLDVVNDFEGNYFGCFIREKLSMRSGETDKAVSVIDERLEKIGKKVAKELKHSGNMDCDAFLVNDTFYFLEINPRFGGGYPFSHEAGMNLAAVYLEWLKGEANKNLSKFNNYKAGIIFSKCDRLLKISDLTDYNKDSLELITTKLDWDKFVNETDSHDFYHTYDYHFLSKADNETPALIKYIEGDISIGIPLLIRNIQGTHYKDATSVYGYSGPISKNIPINFDNANFQKKIMDYFLNNNFISVFSRLNPFIPEQNKILKNIGTITTQGKIVYINLQKDLELQKKGYQRRLKTYINKLRRTCTIRKASSKEDMEIFINIYHDNMKRVNAKKYYYFNKNYFKKIVLSEDFESIILIAVDNETGKDIAASLFILTDRIVQYHLSGTKNDFLHLTPTKLLIDEMRIISTQKGYSCFNLGGGLGGRDDDTLFNFKSTFSKDLKAFNLWKLIINQGIYDDLVLKKGITYSSDFFPLYRSLNHLNVEL